MKSILFIQTHRPHGRLAGQEALDALLMGCAFTRCSLLLLGDGVLQLARGQDTQGTYLKNYASSYSTLKDYGVTDIFCDAACLEQYGLQQTDLVIEVVPQSKGELTRLVQQYDMVLNL